MSKKIYIAGPMSGYPEFNFPAFHAAAADYRIAGWVVFNPAEKDGEVVEGSEAYKTGDHIQAQQEGFDFKSTYLWDLEKVIESNAIHMLPGWEKSLGAVGEHAVALAVQKHDPSYVIIYEGVRDERQQAA